MRLVASVLAPFLLAGCVTLVRPPFVPYSVYVEALVAEEPEALAPFVRSTVAGLLIVGDAPAPPDAQYVTTLRPHPAGTYLRIERRLTQPGFFDGTQLLERYQNVLEAWSGQDTAVVGPHLARIIPQTSSPTCVTDTSNAGLAQPLEPRGPEVKADPEATGVVEEPPHLIGGLEGMQKRLTYPELARRNGTEGVVFVQFIVDEEGAVPCADIVVGLPSGINQSVLETIKESQFTPGRQHGKPVKVRFSLPVRFRLR